MESLQLPNQMICITTLSVKVSHMSHNAISKLHYRAWVNLNKLQFRQDLLWLFFLLVALESASAREWRSAGTHKEGGTITVASSTTALRMNRSNRAVTTQCSSPPPQTQTSGPSACTKWTSARMSTVLLSYSNTRWTIQKRNTSTASTSLIPVGMTRRIRTPSVWITCRYTTDRRAGCCVVKSWQSWRWGWWTRLRLWLSTGAMLPMIQMLPLPLISGPNATFETVPFTHFFIQILIIFCIELMYVWRFFVREDKIYNWSMQWLYKIVKQWNVMTTLDDRISLHLCRYVLDSYVQNSANMILAPKGLCSGGEDSKPISKLC